MSKFSSARINQLKDECEQLEQSNKLLNEQVIKLCRSERILYDTKLELSQQIKRINAINSFSIFASQVLEPELVFEFSIELLHSVFNLDLVVSFNIENCAEIRGAKYQLRGDKKFKVANESKFINFDMNSTFGNTEDVYIDIVKDVTNHPFEKLITEMKEILESEEEDEGFTETSKVFLFIYSKRQSGEPVGIIGGVAFDFENTTVKRNETPSMKDKPFLLLVKRHLEAAFETICYVQDCHQKGLIEAEIGAAKAVQETLLPQEQGAIPNFKLASYLSSAAQTGGDWYGYHFCEKSNELFVFMGDVTGHGIPSTLITGVACGALAASVCYEEHLNQSYKEPEQRADRLQRIGKILNQVILQTGARTERLMTMVMLLIDVETGQATYLNAAHMPVYIISKNNHHVKSLFAAGSRLGYSEDPHFRTKNFQIESDDILFLYTDGLTENDGPFGEILTEKRLKKILLEQSSDLTLLIEEILAETRSLWKNNAPRDDTCLLALKWEGEN